MCQWYFLQGTRWHARYNNKYEYYYYCYLLYSIIVVAIGLLWTAVAFAAVIATCVGNICDTHDHVSRVNAKTGSRHTITISHATITTLLLYYRHNNDILTYYRQVFTDESRRKFTYKIDANTTTRS